MTCSLLQISPDRRLQRSARILKTLPFLTRLTARLVGIGVRAEHVESPEFQPEAVEAH